MHLLDQHASDLRNIHYDTVNGFAVDANLGGNTYPILFDRPYSEVSLATYGAQGQEFNARMIKADADNLTFPATAIIDGVTYQAFRAEVQNLALETILRLVLA